MSNAHGQTANSKPELEGSPRGLFVIDKPSGITSRKALNQIERRLELDGIGHCGSLDPLATGVLVLVSGKARKIQDLIVKGEKGYDMTVTFGATSDTDDGEGEIVATEPAPEPPTREAIEEALKVFQGEVMQIPPTYSALKVEGKRMHSEARKGRPVKAEPRPVVIHEVELTRYEWPEADVVIRCGPGTYARAIARDLGQALGTGGYMSRLERTRVGPLTLDDAVSLEELDRDDMLGIEAFLKDHARLNVPLTQRHLLLRGQTLRTPPGFPMADPCFAWVNGEVIAHIAFVNGGTHFRTKRLLV